MSEPVRPPLVLDSPEFMARSENFANLMSVPDFQERFFRDPAGVAAAEFGLRSETATLGRANRMVYALLADPQFNTWAADFQARVPAELAPDASGALPIAELRAAKAQLMREFTDSIQAHLDPATVTTVQGLDPSLIVAEGDVALVPLTFIAIVVVLVIVAGVAQQEEVMSRKTVQLVIRQLDERQAALVASGRDLNAR